MRVRWFNIFAVRYIISQEYKLLDSIEPENALLLFHPGILALKVVFISQDKCSHIFSLLNL